MIPISTAAIFAALACLHATQASPLALPQAVDTLPHHTDISEDRKFRTDLLTSSGLNCWITKDPDCWAEMKMDEYVLKWAEGPVARGCGTQGIRESFGDCFIRIHEMGPLCNSIGETNCGTEVKSSTDILRYSELVEGKVPITDLEKRQAWLCATNIVAINAFFNTWYTASNDAFSRTAPKITDIINIATPPPEAKSQAWKAVLVNALLAGLAFAPGISAGTTLLSSTARTIKNLEAPGRAILTASSSVFGNVFDFRTDGSAESNLLNIAELEKSLDNFVLAVKDRLEPALRTAINNATAFIEMANTGAFSAEQPPSLPTVTAGLELALHTYIVSVALNSANWYGVVAPQTDVNALLSGQLGEPNVEYGCEAVDPVTKQCNAIWQDVPNNQGFTMVQGSSFLNNPYAKFQGFFGNDGGTRTPYSTPERLFVGAARCRQKANWGTVSLDIENGDLNLDCLSQLKICTYEYSCTQQDESSCKYKESDCSAEPGYGYEPDREGGMPADFRTSNKFYVEPGYMGPFRTGNHQYKLRSTTL